MLFSSLQSGHCTVIVVCPCGMMPMMNPSGSSAVMYLTATKESSTVELFVTVIVALYVDGSVTTDRPVGAVSTPTAASVGVP